MLSFLNYLRGASRSCDNTSSVEPQCYALVCNPQTGHDYALDRLFSGALDEYYKVPTYFDVRVTLFPTLDQIEGPLHNNLRMPKGSLYLLEISCTQDELKSAALAGQFSDHVIAAINAHEYIDDPSTATRTPKPSSVRAPTASSCSVS